MRLRHHHSPIRDRFIEYRITVDGITTTTNRPYTAAKTKADAHQAGHSVSCATNATSSNREIERLSKLAKRVNETLSATGALETR
jgi:hypothetical protein